MSAIYHPVQLPVYEYQVGGCLPPNAPSYVERKADSDLYDAIKRGEFCYVLNSRQMGKSSLQVRTMQRLKAEGIACAVVDLSAIGARQITPNQWYAGIAYTLASSFNLLERFDIETWWCDRNRKILSPGQRFSEFIRKVLLELIPQNLVIFIDEIDSILRLDFKDDFLAAIQACYNNRAYQPEYNRLTFTLLGVATPSDLIRNTNGTPFNIGKAIELCGFKLHEAKPLLKGLEDGKVYKPHSVLREVLAWTGGQPFLTQKLCNLLLTYRHSQSSCSSPTEWVEKLVRLYVLDKWEAADNPEHLKTIRDRLCRCPLGNRIERSERCYQLLRLYQQILQPQDVPARDTKEEMELRLSGLVVKQDGRLKVYNGIYRSVFNARWVEQQLKEHDPPTPTSTPTPTPTPTPPPPPSLDEQLLYDHLQDWVKQESPKQMLDRFRLLFIDGEGYREREIVAALNRMTESILTEQEFKNFLNRCCYILINHWRMYPKHHSAIPRLVELFKNLSSSVVQSPSSRRLRELVQLFVQSEQYQELEHLATLIEPPSAADEVNRPLAEIISWYPYLYSHCLLNQRSSAEHQQIIRQLQVQKQRQFELHLSRYATYLARQIQIERHPSSTQIAKTIQPIPNPTRLSDRELLIALKQFVGKVDGSNTYKDLAHLFLAHTCQVSSYRDFKKDLYEYLIASISPEYGRYQYYRYLAKHLKNTFPDCDFQKVNSILLVQTCRELFNFLVASPNRPEHLLFIDLISNNSSLNTVGLLLKIALLSRQVKPHLEKRFSILFNHYESHTIDNKKILWLVESLDNLNIALGVNFGAVDISFIKLL